MALLVAPGFTDPALEPVGDWLPTRYTRSLSGTEDFTTDADRLLPVIAAHWRMAGVSPFRLDPWMVWLIRHMLETYPPDWPVERLRGQLRFRQAIASIARQNGKSVIAAILAFYFLTMHKAGPRVVGLASIDRQAKIVYDRVKYVVENNAALERELKATASRGIKRRDGSGIYQTLPASEDSAQGEPITGALYDELHLGNSGLWDALVLGQRAQRNALLAGFTTAGDDDSDLLVQLYEDGDAAIAYTEACLEAGDWPEGDDERFGFFVWEGADDELTEANVIAASPAIACGRVDLHTAMADARKLDRKGPDKDGVTGRARRIRYVNNRFVAGSVKAWASAKGWEASAVEQLEQVPGGIVFALERTDAWEWLTITATSRRDDGVLVTEVAASVPDLDHDAAVRICEALNAEHRGAAFAVDRTTLAELGKALRERGLEVWLLTAGEMAAAAAGARAAIARRKLAHPGDPLMTMQMKVARRRDLGDAWRLSRSQSTGDIDAVVSTVAGLHVAATRTVHVRQLF